MKKKLITVLLLTSLVLSGCQIIKPFQPVKESDTSGALLFSDDFSSNTNGWGASGKNIGEINFVYGGLDMKVNTPNSLLWTVTGDQYKNTQIDVDGVLLNGSTNDAFGVVCRFQDNEHFYGFLLSHDGYYGIFKMDGATLALADSQQGLKYSEAIRQGGVVNHIQAVCNGNSLKLVVNGELLSEVEDDSYKQGQIGLIGGTYEAAGVELFFDNLLVYQP